MTKRERGRERLTLCCWVPIILPMICMPVSHKKMRFEWNCSLGEAQGTTAWIQLRAQPQSRIKQHLRGRCFKCLEDVLANAEAHPSLEAQHHKTPPGTLHKQDLFDFWFPLDGQTKFKPVGTKPPQPLRAGFALGSLHRTSNIPCASA